MKSFIYKAGKQLVIILILIGPWTMAHGQVKLNADTLECHMVNFSAGILMPGGGSGPAEGGMRDLYKGPYLDFNLEWAYKWQSGWLASLDADVWFGMSSDNLLRRSERYNGVFLPGDYAMSWAGLDGNVSAYNRALAVRPGVGHIFRVLPKNPNSGILLKMSGGWFMQKTVYSQEYTETPVMQLSGDYAKLYDHRRNGLMLTESLGFIFMSNYITYVNVKLTFEVSQCFSWSSRPYQIDNVMGLNGKDEGRYFDLIYGVKLTWMFPFTGKTSYDYYYY